MIADSAASELLRLCKYGLAPCKYPRWINFVTELPKTATGKIQRFMLSQTAQESNRQDEIVNA